MIQNYMVDTELNVWMRVIEVMLETGDTTPERAVLFADTVLAGYRKTFLGNSTAITEFVANKKAA